MGGSLDTDELLHLRHKVDSALICAGHAPEHCKFHPHVILTRLKSTPAARLGDYAAAHNGFAMPYFRLDHFTFYKR